MKSKGLSRPRFENPESVISYFSSKSNDTGIDIMIAKDSIRFFQLLYMVRSYPSVDFFNSKVELLEYSKTGDCMGKAQKFAASLSPDSDCDIDSSYQIKDVFEKVKSINVKSTPNNVNADFTILFYWAKYLGKMNNSLFEILKTVRENQDINPKIYFINMDFQKEWGMKEIPEIKVQ
jgi:hypothetical protein